MENLTDRFRKIQVGLWIPNACVSIVCLCLLSVMKRQFLQSISHIMQQPLSSLEVRAISSIVAWTWSGCRHFLFRASVATYFLLVWVCSTLSPTIRFYFLFHSNHWAALWMYGDWCWHSFRMAGLGLLYPPSEEKKSSSNISLLI